MAEECNGFQAHCSKLPRENFTCDYNIQLSTAIQLFHKGSSDLPSNYPLNSDEGGLRLGLHSNHSTIKTDLVSYLYALSTLKILAELKFGGGALQHITSS